MTTHIYANLAPLGWTELTSSNAKIESEGKLLKPEIWWEENARLYAPINRKAEDTLYDFPYTYVHFENKGYRVGPYHFQIVEEG